MSDLPFIPGLELSQYLYEEAVRPILEKGFPGLPYSAALIGSGSDVLGFDTPQSMDHDWGPRLMLFLAEADIDTYRPRIEQALASELPPSIHGIPRDLAVARHSETAPAPQTLGILASHSVRLHTVRDFVRPVLNVEFDREWRASDWLSFPSQHLRSLTSGRVFHDGLGQLTALREKLSFYPQDVWLYLLAAQWQRIDQEEPFMGRCGQAGDELGSRLVAARLVKDLMRLCFLMERQYAPYIKWFGTAFGKLGCAAQLAPWLMQALEGNTWEARQTPLCAAYEFAAGMHNHLGITEPLSTKVSTFFGRPFLVIQAGQFVEAIRARITDPDVLSLPVHLGAVDQFTDSTDALNQINRIKRVYQEC
jgi:Domain of unknown function (DUF4037)